MQVLTRGASAVLDSCWIASVVPRHFVNDKLPRVPPGVIE